MVLFKSLVLLGVATLQRGRGLLHFFISTGMFCRLAKKCSKRRNTR